MDFPLIVTFTTNLNQRLIRDSLPVDTPSVLDLTLRSSSSPPQRTGETPRLRWGDVGERRGGGVAISAAFDE